MDIYGVLGSALTAQRLRLDTVSSNLANIQTTRAPDGSLQPYKRKQVVFAPLMDDNNQTTAMAPSLQRQADGRMMLKGGVQNDRYLVQGVQVVEISEDSQTPMQRVYDPAHPDADKQGYVTMPNINVVTEMVDMVAASRAYEASVTALNSAKAMEESALQI
jgi:flagellar basal-body rod protein FlgC